LPARINSRAQRINTRPRADFAQAEQDPLSALAPLMQVRRVEVQEICRFSGGWQSVHDAQAPVWAHFHMVTKGRCRLALPDGHRLTLDEGSLLLVPHGGAHTLSSARGSGVASAETRVDYVGALPLKTNTFSSSETELICGRLQFDAGPSGLSAFALPAAIVINVRSRQSRGHMRDLVRMIDEGLKTASPGAVAVASHLSSALFILMMRAHFEEGVAARSLVALLNCASCARAVNAMMNRPARSWTLDDLANIARVSRATLVRDFRKAAGIAPLAFLTELRLVLARQSLVSSQTSLQQIALSVGYLSDSAFTRAFSRRFGKTPGSMR
jgi:AraC family transcriptional activator of mtrCDE